MKKVTLARIAIGIAFVAMASIARPAELDELTVMALGAVDGRAVVKMSDGKMQVLKIGDTVPGTRAVVTQVLADRLILEETVVGADDKSEKKQIVSISKPAQPGGRSSVQRLESEPPPVPPAIMGVSGEAQPASTPATPPGRRNR